MADLDYDRWAQTYDDTRGASPSVLEPLTSALGAPEGRSLLDIGCGTGNFALPLAREGFRIALCDISPEMVRRAAEKLPEAPAVIADAQRLPFRDAPFDCAVSVNVLLGHVPNWQGAFREARRVLRAGPLIVKGSTRETTLGNWVLAYLPAILERALPHQYLPEQVIAEALRDAGFSRVDVRRIHYRDLVDGSMQALKHVPEALLDDARLLNTATFKRIPIDVLRPVLEAVRRDHRSGRLREVIARYEPANREYGDGSLFVAYP